MSQYLAYKYVMLAIMCCQINEYAPRMGLPLQTPIKKEEIRFVSVGDPVLMAHYTNYSGRVIVTNYSFTFGPRWHNIYNLDKHGFISLGVAMSKDEPSRSGLERASRMKYVVSTNDVYGIASNWLVALDIDLKKLEAFSPPRFGTNVFESNRGPVPSPLLSVQWFSPKVPEWNPTGTYVLISAVTGELLKLFDGDGSFSKRGPWITQLDKLMSIPDAEFLKYSVQDRMDLAEKFAGITNRQDYLTNIPPATYDKLFRSSDEKPKGQNLRE